MGKGVGGGQAPSIKHFSRGILNWSVSYSYSADKPLLAWDMAHNTNAL